MNIFSKVEQNLEHGGIKINIQVAQSVSRKDASLPVIISIVNGAKVSHTIKHVVAEVHATENNSGYGMALNNAVQLGNTTDNNEMYTMETLIIAKSESYEEFILQPNETKTINLNITINDSNRTSGGHTSNTNTLDPHRYKYEVVVSADIADIKLKPHTHQSLQIL